MVADAGAVVGGAFTSRGWPAVGYLEWNRPEADLEETQQCGATLLASRWAVTAAHCLFAYERQPVLRIPDAALAVTFGRRDQSHFFAGTRAGVIRSIVHEQRDRDRLAYDLALLELDRDVPGPYARIAAPGEDHLWAAGKEALLLGWGLEAFDQALPPDVLKEGPEPLGAPAACAAARPGWDPATQVCAAGDAATTCFGDSGGPLMVPAPDGWRLVGVVSSFAGADPCDLAQTTFYMAVAQPVLRDWIALRTGP